MSKSRKKLLSQGRLAVLIIIVVLAVDQIIKLTVKTHMYMHQRIHVTDWFYILFTENPGMAFGWELFDKIFLTSFRIFAVAVIIYILCRAINKKMPIGLIICLSLVLAGAVGNIIDCVFYGLIFNNPIPPHVARFVPFGTGYESAFQGRVVDMFYFPLIDTNWPDWMPWIGGKHFIFFSPVFNFADASISCGIVALLLFYHKLILREQPTQK